MCVYTRIYMYSEVTNSLHTHVYIAIHIHIHVYEVNSLFQSVPRQSFKRPLHKGARRAFLSLYRRYLLLGTDDDISGIYGSVDITVPVLSPRSLSTSAVLCEY